MLKAKCKTSSSVAQAGNKCIHFVGVALIKSFVYLRDDDVEFLLLYLDFIVGAVHDL